MQPPLSYLLIIQKSGLPVYAQSFEFDSDEACQSFNKLIRSESTQANAHLMGGYFSSMQLFADEMVEDKLNLLDLGFEKFEILGLIREEVFFIGIFQNFPEETNQRQPKLEFLEGIAQQFIQRYPIDVIHDSYVSHVKFADFTDIIQEMSNGSVGIAKCRNCLTKCTSQNKGCLPHSFYFSKVNFSEDLVELKSNLNRIS